MKAIYTKYISMLLLLIIFGMSLSGVEVARADIIYNAGNYIQNAEDAANAQPVDYTPLAPLPDLKSDTLQSQTTVDFKTYAQDAYNLLIAMGAVAAVFMITWGGFEYMTTDAVSGKSDGLKKIQNAIYGLLLILCSYLILRTIDPRFVNVPSSLVAPLNLSSQNLIAGTYDEFQAAMDSVSAEYQHQADTAIAANNAAKAAAAAAQQQVTQAQAAVTAACADNNYTSADCTGAVLLLNQAKDQLNTAQANVGVTSNLKNMTGILNNVNSGGDTVNGANGTTTNTFLQSDPAVLAKAQTAITSSYQNAIGIVNASGGDPNSLSLIQQQRNIANDQVLIQQVYAAVAAKTMTSEVALNNIKLIQAQADRVTDPSLQVLVKSVDTTAQVIAQKITN